MSARARGLGRAGSAAAVLVAAIGAGPGCFEAAEGQRGPGSRPALAARARAGAPTRSTDAVDPRAWVALRQRLRRAPRGSAASGSQGLADLLRPALAADLLSAPLCEELLRTARVLRSEGASGASLALASALEGAVSSLALDPRLASEAVLQRMEVGDLRTTSARARLHWLVARAGLAEVERRVLRTLEHGSCDGRCTPRCDQASDEVSGDEVSGGAASGDAERSDAERSDAERSDAARSDAARSEDARARVLPASGASHATRARAAHAWHEPPHAVARALGVALSNFLDGEPKRE